MKAAQTIQLWDATTGKETKQFEVGQNTQVTGVAFSPDKKSLAIRTSMAEVQLWDLAAGKRVKSWRGPQGYGGMGGLYFSPDGKYLVQGSRNTDSAPAVWEVASGQRLRTARSPNCLIQGVGFDRDRVVMLGMQAQAFLVWDLVSGKRADSSEGHLGSINALAFRDGKLITSANDRRMLEWSLTGRLLGALPEPRVGERERKLPIPGFYDCVRAMSDRERESMKSLPAHTDKWRKDLGVMDGVSFSTMKGVHPYEQTWRFPAVTVIAQEASSFRQVSNQVLPRARAIISCRIVPDQDPAEVFEQLKAVLTKDPPWGVKETGTVKWWMTSPTGPAFEAAMASMKEGFGKDAAMIGCGGTIGFVGPLAELFGGAPALLMGIEDPQSNAHAPNESLHEGDWKNLMRSLALLFEKIGALPGGKVK